MGAASGLFYSANDADKQTLHKRATPSGDQFEEQQERWNLLADHLVADLRARSGYSIRTWLQGSYKFGTQVRPPHGLEFDIDLGVYFLWEGEPDDGDFDSVALKLLVQDSLKTYAQNNDDDVVEVTPVKTRCARIRYRNGFHIDVPAYHLDAEQDRRELATANGWEESDPKGIYLWFRDQFEDWKRQKVRRCVRYVKAWAALKFAEVARPSSIALTVLTADAASELDDDDFRPDDDALLTLVVSKISRRLRADAEVPNPIDKKENLVRISSWDMDAFVSELGEFVDAAERATGEVTELQAADIWQEPFEHLFPMPDLEGDETQTASLLPTSVAMPEIAVRATSLNGPAAGFTGRNKIGPIPKNCNVEFTIVNPFDLPRNCRVLWMVRNEGQEAENVNDLGHIAGEGLSVSRNSAYRGTHFMDCIVKVGATTVAMRRVPVTISGQEIPKRNPRLRPEWVKLRGRR